MSEPASSQASSQATSQATSQARIAEYSKQDRIEIIADVRENKELIAYLGTLGAEVTVKQMDLGDYQISDRVIVERKTTSDFEASIMDGRLFEQAVRLEEFEKPIIIIEGREGKPEAERIHQNAFIGAIISLIVDFNILILFTKDEYKTAELIFSIAKREQLQEKRPIRFLEKRKALTFEHQQYRVLESFPTLGPQTAKKLMEEFHSLESVFKADEKELARVIGPAKAKKMKELLVKRKE
jgi:Fanconi anemia group M protein